MADLTTRPYEPTDAAAVTALMNTIDTHGGGRPGWSEDEVGAFVGSIIADPATDTRLVTTADGTLVAMGLVPTPPPGGFRVDVMGGVHPDWRGQGLGREIFAWQYARATEIHEAQAPGDEWQAESGVMLGEPSGPRLFARFGFAPVRYFFEMVAPTAGVRDAKLPAELISSTPVDGGERPLYEAHMEAFADHWGFQKREYEKWLPLALENPGFLPELSRVAYAGDEVAGYVLSYRDNEENRLYIGQVGTRRPWRGTGVASALLAEVIDAAAQAGFTSVGLGVDADSPTGAVGVYERAGFVKEHSFVAYRRPIG